jgi:UDP-glucuronate 4-epimerase
VNIGNAQSVKLMDYISCLEKTLKIKADINFMPMQVGDVEKTEANTELLLSLTGFRPHTGIDVGIRKFVEWYKSYYG